MFNGVGRDDRPLLDKIPAYNFCINHRHCLCHTCTPDKQYSLYLVVVVQSRSYETIYPSYLNLYIWTVHLLPFILSITSSFVLRWSLSNLLWRACHHCVCDLPRISSTYDAFIILSSIFCHIQLSLLYNSVSVITLEPLEMIPIYTYLVILSHYLFIHARRF